MRCSIVAASQSHLRSVAPRVQGGSAREQIDGVDYLWLRTPAYRGNGVGRVFNIAVFCLRLAARARQLAREFRPDVVIASSTYPMDIWPARRIARIAGARAGARGARPVAAVAGRTRRPVAAPPVHPRLPGRGGRGLP